MDPPTEYTFSAKLPYYGRLFHMYHALNKMNLLTTAGRSKEISMLCRATLQVTITHTQPEKTRRRDFFEPFSIF